MEADDGLWLHLKATIERRRTRCAHELGTQPSALLNPPDLKLKSKIQMSDESFLTSSAGKPGILQYMDFFCVCVCVQSHHPGRGEGGSGRALRI